MGAAPSCFKTRLKNESNRLPTHPQTERERYPSPYPFLCCLPDSGIGMALYEEGFQKFTFVVVVSHGFVENIRVIFHSVTCSLNLLSAAASIVVTGRMRGYSWSCGDGLST